MREPLRWLLWLMVLTVASAARGDSTTAPSTRPAGPLHLVVLHVNDVHGQTAGITGAGGRTVGGYARLASAVAAVRAETGLDRIFLVHAGDELARGDTLTTTTLGQANVELMNSVGFDLWVPGNGEFYFGVPNLQQRIAQSRARVLSANIRFRSDGTTLARPYVIESVGDLRVAFLGLCFIRNEHPSAWALSMDDPVTTARSLMPEIRKQADLVVAITHIGLEEDRRLARSTSGIDLIVGGHSHSTLPRGQWERNTDGRPVLIVQAGDHLNYLGRADLTVARADGRWAVQLATARLTPLDQSIREDAPTKALIARLAARQSATSSQPAATAP